MKDWVGAERLMTDADDVRFAKSNANGRFIHAGDSVELFSVSDPELVRIFSHAIASGVAKLDLVEFRHVFASGKRRVGTGLKATLCRSRRRSVSRVKLTVGKSGCYNG